MSEGQLPLAVEPLADWCGKQVKIKGLLGGSPEVLMVAELVGVSELGAILSWNGCRTFFPWSSVVSMRLEEKVRSAQC